MTIYPLIAGLLIACAICGCSTRLPTYPAMSDEASLAIIADRQATVQRIVAECDINLTDADGQSVTLEGVLVARPPGNVRLRAWKFGHAVFDLTLVDGKGWIMIPEQGPGAQQLNVTNMPASRVGEALDLLGPLYFRSAKPVGGDNMMLLAAGPALGRDNVLCEVQRRTLTPRRFVVHAGSDLPPSELLLDQYAVVDDNVWPMRIRLRGKSGGVLLRLRNVEINGEIAPTAFVPPKRAKALP